jgi:hypothetical protein
MGETYKGLNDQIDETAEVEATAAANDDFMDIPDGVEDVFNAKEGEA